MQNTRGRQPPLPGWTGYPVGFLAATTMTTAAVAVLGTGHPLWILVALTATATVVAAGTTLRSAVASAVLCWAMYAGFVLGRRGDLALTAESARAATVLVTVALLSFGIAAAVRATRGTARAAARSVALPAPRRRLDTVAGRPS